MLVKNALAKGELVLKTIHGAFVLVLLAVFLSGCFGPPSGVESSTSADVALLGNRAAVIQSADDLQDILGYIYDPLEFNLAITLNEQPFCDAYPGAVPECEDMLNELISHQDLVDFYSEFVAPQKNYEDLGYDYSFTDPVVSVSGEVGTTTQTYTISNADVLGDGKIYNVSGVYETKWAKISGEWKMYKLSFTINISET